MAHSVCGESQETLDPADNTSMSECLVVGRVNHHSIDLSWASVGREPRLGPPEEWTLYSLEQESHRKHTCSTIYVGYGIEFTVGDLEPSSTYKFRLRTSLPSGESFYSQMISVSTAREPINGKNLHQAVLMNDEEALTKVLQSKTVDVNVPDRLGFTPLMVATMKGFSSIVHTLVRHDADVNMKNSSGKDSLMLACFCGHLDIVKYLRECGAVWSSQDRAGCTALHWAVDGGHLPVIRHMIEDSCEVAVRDSVSGWTPLMRVSVVSGDTTVADLLIRAGADVNVRDRDGKTPLMIAVLNNHEDLVRLLLENGADHHVRNEFGSGVAEMAKAFGRKSIIHLLDGKRSQ